MSSLYMCSDVVGGTDYGTLTRVSLRANYVSYAG